MNPMAFHHPYHNQQNHHTTTTSFCCCQPQPPQPPPPPCHHQPPPPQPLPTTTATTDPFIMAAMVAQLLQSSNPQNFYSQHVKPTVLNTQNLDSHQIHPHSPFLSLLQRIDALEASLQRFSSGSLHCSSLRDAAAHTIQAHFRAHLVHRSRTLGQLQDLASVKSALASLKSSLSQHGFLDFDFLSHKAMELLLKLDSIQSGNKMIKDSLRSVTREIVEFLELIDGVCVKRHKVLTRKVKNMRLVRNDNRGVRDNREISNHNVGSKCRNVGGEEKKLIVNLRERVEKIGKMSKALEEQEQELEHEVYGDDEIKGVKHGSGDDDIIDQITSNYRMKSGLNMKNNAQSSNAKKRVCFLEDGNLIRFFDIDGGSRSNSRLVEVIEDTDNGSLDEEEAPSDDDGSSHSSEDMKKGKSDELSEECDNQDEFTFYTNEPSKARGNMVSKLLDN